MNRYHIVMNKDVDIDLLLTYRDLIRLDKTKANRLLRGCNFILMKFNKPIINGGCFCTNEERESIREKFFEIYEEHKNDL